MDQPTGSYNKGKLSSLFPVKKKKFLSINVSAPGRKKNTSGLCSPVPMFFMPDGRNFEPSPYIPGVSRLMDLPETILEIVMSYIGRKGPALPNVCLSCKRLLNMGRNLRTVRLNLYKHDKGMGYVPPEWCMAPARPQRKKQRKASGGTATSPPFPLDFSRSPTQILQQPSILSSPLGGGGVGEGFADDGSEGGGRDCLEPHRSDGVGGDAIRRERRRQPSLNGGPSLRGDGARRSLDFTCVASSPVTSARLALDASL